MSQNWFLRFRKSPAHTQTNIVCTALIMLATVAYAIIAGWQLFLINKQIGIMQGTLDETKRSGEQSTEQMWSAIGNINWLARSMDWSQKETKIGIETSERQGNKALSASIASLHQEQRAWVGTGNIATVPPDSLHDTGSKMEVTNTGRTPAIDVMVRAHIDLALESLDGKLALQPDFPDDYKAGEVPGDIHLGILVPSAVYRAGFQVEVGKSEGWHTPGVKWIQYLHGRISYEDVFGKNHWLVFCYVRDKDLPSIEGWSACKIHNEIDKEKE